jgi:hypothetical protein
MALKYNLSCYVVAFVRFVNDREIQENFFSCKELPETSEGQDMFTVFSSYVETNCVASAVTVPINVWLHQRFRHSCK